MDINRVGEESFEEIVKNTVCEHTKEKCVGLSYCEYGCFPCSVKSLYRGVK